MLQLSCVLPILFLDLHIYVPVGYKYVSLTYFYLSLEWINMSSENSLEI